MSIKDLFDNRKPNTETLSAEAFYTGSQDVESLANIKAKQEEFDRFVPHVDYATASNFAKYGSAELYYESAFKRIYQQYPYDGSRQEKNLFEISSSYLDKYVFDNVYPRTNGYITLGAQGLAGSYGLWQIRDSNPKEYIHFQGGPHTASSGMTSEPLAQTFDNSMLYDASTRRGSSLEFTATSGSTIEFWMKKDVGSHIAIADRQVIFDLWNQVPWGGTSVTPGNPHYGRLTLMIGGDPTAGSGGPFYFMMASGSDGYALPNDIISEKPDGSIAMTVDDIYDGAWHHYAFSFLSQSAGMRFRLYQDGNLKNERTLNGISSIQGPTSYWENNAMVGGLLHSLQESATLVTGSGKLSGSLDEFRYWKVERSGREIKNNFFIPIGGGTNNPSTIDIANLGIYYKFNEGITGIASLDSSVLDYSGRIANGTWTGYTGDAGKDAAGQTIYSRNTGSAMVLSGKATSEFQDPIIYSSSPQVSSSLAELKATGSYADLDNTSLFYNLLPSWVVEEDTATAYQVKYLCQIMASYFDTLHAQISASLYIHDETYPSASYKAYPFMDRLLRNRAFVTPETFVDASVIEKVLQKNDYLTFEKSLDEVRKLIYHNIYNNLEYIYKSKGTEKSFRNLFHCYGIDSELIKMNLYADDATFTFKDNYENTTVEKRYIDFNNTGSFGGTVYQTSSAAASSSPYIAASLDAVSSSVTLEAEVIFPKKLKFHEPGFFYTPFTTVSLFGFHSVNTGAPNADPWLSSDFGLSAYFIKNGQDKPGGFFRLQSYRGGSPWYLDSDNFSNVYDNSKWNLAIRIKAAGYPLNDGVPIDPAASRIVEFHGINTIGDAVINTFTVSKSDSFLVPIDAEFLTDPKKVYAGAHYQNYTGSLLNQSDVKISSVRWWQSYLDDDIIKMHAFDPSNHGVTYPLRMDNIFQNIDGDEDITTSGSIQVPQIETLAMDWDFGLVTGSDGSGDFTTADLSSGSIETMTRYGPWMGNIVNAQHPGRGANFTANYSRVADKNFIFAARQRLPENVYSSDMVTVMTDEKEFFFEDPDVSDNFYSFEKSMYGVISQQMLKMFTTVTDFNNLIGEPVHAYRESYKGLDKLRQLFFDKVENEPDIERFLEFYKWIDSSISHGIQQLYPASARFSEGVRNVVESHIFERSKYVRKHSLLAKRSFTEGPMKGIGELDYSWQFGHGQKLEAATIEIEGLSSLHNETGTTITLIDELGNSNTWETDDTEVYSASDYTQIGTNNTNTNGSATEALWRGFNDAITRGLLQMSISPASAAEANSAGKLTLTQIRFGPLGNTLATLTTGMTMGSGDGVNGYFDGGVGDGGAQCLWLNQRQDRSKTWPYISDLETIRKAIVNNNNFQGPILQTVDGVAYEGSTYIPRKLAKPYKLGLEFTKDLHSGINFSKGKDRTYYRTNTYPQFAPGNADPRLMPDNVMSVGSGSSQGLYGFPVCEEINSQGPILFTGDRAVGSWTVMDYHNKLKNVASGDYVTITDFEGSTKRFYLTGSDHSFLPVGAIGVNTASLPTNFKNNFVSAFESSNLDTVVSGEVTYDGNYNIVFSFRQGENSAGGNNSTPISTIDGSNPSEYIDVYFAGGSNPTTLTTQPQKKWKFEVVNSAANTLGYNGQLSGEQKWPFNFMSGTMPSGYNSIISSSFNSNVIAVNVHSDAYTRTSELGMQGPFTDAWVGGVQARHVRVNRYEGTQIDDATNRPESYGILVGDGDIGLIAADYGGATADPSKPRGYWYRDTRAKRPLNIANIQYNSSSAIIGNYRHNYEIVNTVGRSVNNMGLRAHQNAVFGTGVTNNQYLPVLQNTALTKKVYPKGTLDGNNGKLLSLRDSPTTFGWSWETDNSAALFPSDGSKIGTLGNSSDVSAAISIAKAFEMSGLFSSVVRDTAEITVTLKNIFTPEQLQTLSFVCGAGFAGLDPGEGDGASGPRNAFTYYDGTTNTKNDLSDLVAGVRNLYYLSGSTTLPYTLISQAPMTSGNIFLPSSIEGTSRQYKFSNLQTTYTETSLPANSYNYTNIFLKPSTSLEDGTHNKTVIVSQFSAPGGFETSNGYLDTYAKEYSAYNALPWRNLTVRSKGSGEAGTVRVTDQLGYRRGLSRLLQLHCGKFGLDSEYGSPEAALFQTIPGAVSGNPISNPYIDIGHIDWNCIVGNATAGVCDPDRVGTEMVSISAWIKFDSDRWNYNQSAIQLGRFDNPYGEFRIRLQYGKIYFYTTWNNTNNFWVTDDSVLSGDTWHHIAVVYSATDTSNVPSIYVDGSLKALNAGAGFNSGGSGPAGSWDGITAGMALIGQSDTLGEPWKGQIDEVAIWDRLLSAEDIESIYNVGRAESLYPTGLDSDVQAWWRMGENSDANRYFHDMSGFGRHAIGNKVNLKFMNDASGSFHKINKNVGRKLAVSSSYPKFNYDYDNGYVTHPIPRSDYQYSWIDSAIGTNYDVYSGQQKMFGHAPESGEIPDNITFTYNSSYLTSSIGNSVDTSLNLGVGRVWPKARSISGWYYIDQNYLAATPIMLFIDVRSTNGGAAHENLVIIYDPANYSMTYVVPYETDGAIYYEQSPNTMKDYTSLNPQWFHLVITFDGERDSTPMIYINGQLTTQIAPVAYFDVSGEIARTGSASGNKYSPVAQLKYGVDELSVWGRVLTPIEINRLYRDPSAIPSISFNRSGLINWWRFGDNYNIYGDLYRSPDDDPTSSGTPIKDRAYELGYGYNDSFKMSGVGPSYNTLSSTDTPYQTLTKQTFVEAIVFPSASEIVGV